MTVKWTVDEYVAAELGIRSELAKNLVELFEQGNEIAFIARYRRHLTSNATPDDLRHALDAFNSAKSVIAKAEKLIKRADALVEDKRQKESLKNALSRTMDATELESLIEPFKKEKKGSLALRARELGVGDICERIRNGELVNFEKYVNRSEEVLGTAAKVEKQAINLFSHDLHREESTSLFMQKVCELNNFEGIRVSVVSTLTKKARALTKDEKDFHLLKHFELYTNFERDARTVEPYQVLALERASSKEIINWKVRVSDNIERKHPSHQLQRRIHPSHLDFLRKSVADSTKRFLVPAIERCIRRRLMEKAERSSIDCFAKNVRELLLTAPIKGYPVLAIDPGYAHGCKFALVSAYGEVIDTGVLYLRSDGRNNWIMDEHNELIVITSVSKARSPKVIIAVGNGTASRHTQIAVASLIQRNAFAPINVQFCIVSECGASIYSATDLAAEELPNLDINLRSAVSLARRVIDPISEYVKIAPKHLGVGSYQHSVNEKRLDEMLDIVVRECVSSVGVDVNVASLQILQKVSGLNKKTAANIIKYRQSNGRIPNRDTIKTISGIGPKSFEQCAGFLFIYEDSNNSTKRETPEKKKRKIESSRNPLDSTHVHPESYHLAYRLLSMAGLDVSQIGTDSFKSKLASIANEVRNGEPELRLTWELLCQPVLTCNPPKLLTAVQSVESLKEGDVLEGVVRNQVQFGVFVDIGVGIDALAHRSVLPPVVPQVNAPVKVKVTRLELDRKRINVTIL